MPTTKIKPARNVRRPAEFERWFEVRWGDSVDEIIVVASTPKTVLYWFAYGLQDKNDPKALGEIKRQSRKSTWYEVVKTQAEVDAILMAKHHGRLRRAQRTLSHAIAQAAASAEQFNTANHYSI